MRWRNFFCLFRYSMLYYQCINTIIIRNLSISFTIKIINHLTFASMKQIFFKQIYFSKKSFKFCCHFPKIYALKHFSLHFWKYKFYVKEIHPKHLYKRKNVFCILLLTYQFLVVGFSLFSKRFFADYRKIDILNERKFGPPRFVLFCLKTSSLSKFSSSFS